MGITACWGAAWSVAYVASKAAIYRNCVYLIFVKQYISRLKMGI